MLNNENNKLSKMSSTDYSSQKLDELTFEDNDVISCPSCHNEQLSYNKKGFGVGKALVGVTLFGLWGTLGGTIGQDEIYATCLKCGKKFKVRKNKFYIHKKKMGFACHHAKLMLIYIYTNFYLFFILCMKYNTNKLFLLCNITQIIIISH